MKRPLALTIVPHDIAAMSSAEKLYQFAMILSPKFLTDDVLVDFGFAEDMDVERIFALEIMYMSAIIKLKITPHDLHLHRIYGDLDRLLRESRRYKRLSPRFDNVHVSAAHLALPQDNETDTVRAMKKDLMRYRFVESNMKGYDKSNVRYTDYNQAMSLIPINQLLKEFSSFRWELPGVGVITRFGKTNLKWPAISIGDKTYGIMSKFRDMDFMCGTDEELEYVSISITEWLCALMYEKARRLKGDGEICSVCDQHPAIKKYKSINRRFCRLCIREIWRFSNIIFTKWVLLREIELLPELQSVIFNVLVDKEIYC